MEAIQILTSIISVALVGGMLKWFDSRNEKRGRARDSFNLLILHGFEAVGKVAILSAYKHKEQGANGGIDKAIEVYEGFEKEVEAFKKKSVKEAVRL